MQPDEIPAGIQMPESGQHLPVRLVLVDSTTRLIAGMRLVTWPHPFHVALYKAVQSQQDNKSTVKDGAREIGLWVERYPEPDDLVARRADIKCHGGYTVATVR